LAIDRYSDCIALVGGEDPNHERAPSIPEKGTLSSKFNC
jgi:hypothetical protein